MTPASEPARGETGVTGTCRSTQSSRRMTFAGSIPTRSTKPSRAASATRSPLHRRVAHRRRPRHAAVVDRSGRRLHRRGDPRRDRRHDRSASAPPTWSISPRAASTRPRRCSPPATTRPQYNGIKLCRAGAAPVGEQTGLIQIKEMVASGVTHRGEVAGKVETVDLLDEFAAARAGVRRPGRAAAARGRRRHRERDGWARRPQGVRRPAVRPHGPVRRARRDLPEPPGRPDPGREPEGSPAGRARRRRRHRPRVRRRRRPRVPRRRSRPARQRLDHHRHRGQGDPRAASRRDDRLQPHLLEGACPRSSARTAARRCARESGTRSSSR